MKQPDFRRLPVLSQFNNGLLNCFSFISATYWYSVISSKAISFEIKVIYEKEEGGKSVREDRRHEERRQRKEENEESEGKQRGSRRGS